MAATKTKKKTRKMPAAFAKFIAKKNGATAGSKTAGRKKPGPVAGTPAAAKGSAAGGRKSKPGTRKRRSKKS
jgi:hypothetical protein